MKTENEFMQRLTELRRDFPQVYIEIWAPGDWPAAWDDPLSEEVAGALRKTFDAQFGTNHLRVAETFEYVRTESASREAGWITDHLPPEGELVEVTAIIDGVPEVCLGSRVGKVWRRRPASVGRLLVTAWRPMPEPYPGRGGRWTE